MRTIGQHAIDRGTVAGGRCGARGGTRRGPPLWVALLLAGCGGGTTDYNAVDVPAREARAEAAIERAVAEKGPASVALSGVPVSSPTAGVVPERMLPAAFQGYWGVAPIDCELANTDAAGRINVDGDTIRFHESRARVSSVDERSAVEVIVRLAFSGEGQHWRRADRLRLEAGGTTLVRSEEPRGAVVRYQRC